MVGVKRISAIIGSMVALASYAVVSTGGAYAATAVVHTCFGQKATIVGSAKGTTIRGTAGNDVIDAGAGNDTIYGKGGNDLICGGTGADKIYGGTGNDWIDGGQGGKVGKKYRNDTIDPGTGTDFVSPVYSAASSNSSRDVISFAAATSGVTIDAANHKATWGSNTVTWLGDAASILGSRYADTFTGGPANDYFIGNGGADHATGGAGDDYLRDAASTNSSAASLDAGPGNDVLISYGGHDTLLGGDGSDTILDYSRDATVIDAGAGDDTVYDGLAISSANSDLGGAGNDTLHLYANTAKNSLPRLTIDLGTGKGTFSDAAATTFPIGGFETYDVHGVGLTFTGTGAAERVRSDGMLGMRVTGNGGADVFCGGTTYDSFTGGASTVVYPTGLYPTDSMANHYTGITVGNIENPLSTCPIKVD